MSRQVPEAVAEEEDKAPVPEVKEVTLISGTMLISMNLKLQVGDIFL